MSDNPTGLKGIEFIEYCSKDPDMLYQTFKEFGFSRLAESSDGELVYYNQNDINFIINNKKNGHSFTFKTEHGPSVGAMGLRVVNAKAAFDSAIKSGARMAKGEYDLPAIYGIGDSLIYFIDNYESKDFYKSLGFVDESKQELTEDKGFLVIDHLTNNVGKGEMEKWANFYKDIFAFTEVRYFDIKGAKTGLISYALQSPCKTFCIPINEGTDKHSQINEYLDEYNGPGIQHIAFLSSDIVSSLSKMKSTSIETLDIDDEYYSEVFDRVPNVTEDHAVLKDYQILVDGDEEGYLLQIFTKNIIGPIFIEIIQRKNHNSFGEGNFGALFRSIERDQIKRGYLK